MGGAKTVLLSGLYVIIGLYAASLRNADYNMQQAAESFIQSDQAVEIARAGIEFAINDLGTVKPNKLPTASGLSVMDGTLSYDVTDRSSDEVEITSTGIFSGQTATIVATVKLMTQYTISKKKKWSRWVIENIYVQSDVSPKNS